MVNLSKLIKAKTPTEKRKKTIIKGIKKLMCVRYEEDGAVYGWQERIVYTRMHGFDRIKIVATPEQIMKPLFDGALTLIDADPITNNAAFRKEVFNKLHDRRFLTTIFNSHGEAHTFYVWLEWKP